MYYFFQVLFKVFSKIYYLAGVISLWLKTLCKKKSCKIYRFFKRSYIETYITIIEIGISISLGIIPGIFFCVGFFCSTFVLDFVSLICFPDHEMWMIFPVVGFSFHVFFLLIFCFDIFYSVLKMNLHCFSAVLQCLSNETGNHFAH